jgi:putative DNA primase/helicase
MSEEIASDGFDARPPPPDFAQGDTSQESVSSDHFKYTDTANADQLVAQHGDDLRYCNAWATWLHWDGSRWQRDLTGEVDRRAKAVVAKMQADADAILEAFADGPPDPAAKALVGWAKKSAGAGRRAAMVQLASVEKEIVAKPEDFDADPWKLNVANGTVNLKTGDLVHHKREDLLTKITPILYDAKAECPLFLQFLDDIFLSRQDLIEFVRRAIGYTLTGLTNEQVFFVCYGTGKNGKSVLLKVLEKLLGDYSRVASFDTLSSRDVNPGAPRPDLVRLRDARLVVASEPDQRTHLSESTLKLITGQDTVVARSLHEKEQEFTPVLKLWLMANHKPRASESNHGFWRRVRLIPFDYRVPDDKQDKHLGEKLEAELPGILAWAVRACVDWQRSGLGEAAAVVAATQAYQDEMDVIGQFIGDRCVRDSNAIARKGELFDAFTKWCEENGEREMSKKTFGMRLAERGIIEDRNEKSRFWRGIGLNA